MPARAGVDSGDRVDLQAGTVHPSSTLGPGVEIAPDARIGPNCHVSGRTSIGARTELIGGITLIGDATIGEGCVIEPGVTMTNMPVGPGGVSGTLVIGAGVHVGAGSVLAGGISIGAGARIGAGTAVLRNVPPYAIVQGNPAAIVGYATSSPPMPQGAASAGNDSVRIGASACSVAGVQLYGFPRIRDLRGDLSVGEFGRTVPFVPQRYFLVFDVPSAETRGEHAHRECQQFLICVSGSVAILVDDGTRREEIVLDAPNMGLYIPPRVWALQYKYSPSATLLVFASHHYDPADYIRDYDAFLRECGPAR